jgi:hypothetical protein
MPKLIPKDGVYTWASERKSSRNVRCILPLRLSTEKLPCRSGTCQGIVKMGKTHYHFAETFGAYLEFLLLFAVQKASDSGVDS